MKELLVTLGMTLGLSVVILAATGMS